MTIRVGSDDAERKVLADVKKFGWHCLNILKLFLTEICGGETKVSISRSGQSDIWDVQVSMYMVPTHAAITEAESRLGNIALGFGGSPDGWGCFNVKRES